MTKLLIYTLALIISITNIKTALNLWKEQNKVASVATLFLSVFIIAITAYLFIRLKV